MRNFLRKLKFDSKRNFNKKIVLIALLFLILSVAFTYVGINKKNKINNDMSKFVKIEINLTLGYHNVNQYGIAGLRTNAISSKLFCLFYNSTPFCELHSFIDNSIKLQINKPQKGAKAFKHPYGKNNLDFSWFFFVFFSAASFLFGFAALRNKKFNKMILNFTGLKSSFASTILSCLLVMLVFLIIIYLIIIILFHVNWISLSGGEIANLGFFFLVAFAVNAGFLILGSAFGSFKNIYLGVGLTLLSWFVFIFLIPEIAGSVLSNYTDSHFESMYAHELKKLEIFSKAEKKIFEEASKYETPAEIKSAYERVIKEYLDTDFKEILKAEEKMLRDTQKAADMVHFCGIFFPSVFYKTVGNEVSGFAFNGYIDLYRSNIKYYKNFVKYCSDNRIDGKKPSDFPFIKDKKDYTFHMKSSLPKYFRYGMLICLLYILAALCFSYIMYKKRMFPAPEKADRFDQLNTTFRPGKYYLIDIEQQDAADQIYNVFSGRGQKFTGKISLGQKNLGAEKQDFFYLPNINDIPKDIKPGVLLDLAAGVVNPPKEETDKLRTTWGKKLKKPYGNLKPMEKIEFLFGLAALKKPKIYLMEEPFSGVRRFGPEDILHKLKKEDVLFVELLLLPPSKHKCYDRYTRIVLHEDEDKYKEDIVTGK